MKLVPSFLLASCAGLLASFLVSCSGESTDAADAKTTLSPAGVYTVKSVTILAPGIEGARAVTQEEVEEAVTSAVPSLVTGSSFTLSAAPADSGFALTFTLPDGKTRSASSSAASVGEPGGTHHTYRAGDAIASFAVTGPVQGEISIRATADIRSAVNGGTTTNFTTNATFAADASTSSNGTVVVTNIRYSASSSHAISPDNASLSASLTFPDCQITATASGPSGTVLW
jgi:hypothetical protein